MKPLFEPTTLVKPKTGSPQDVTDVQPKAIGPSPILQAAVAPAIAPVAAANPFAMVKPDTTLAATRPSGGSLVSPPPITDDQITAIGADAANALKGVSTELLAQVRATDAAEFGKGLNDLVVMAKGLTPDQLKDQGVMGRIKGLFSTAKERMVSQYASVEKQLDTLTLELDAKAQLHKKRISDLDKLYENNMHYHQALEAAVHTCQQYLVQVEQAQKQAEAVARADSFDAQVIADYQRLFQRLEKRISDLQRAMLLSKQVAPQIRMMQEDARSLVGSFGDVKTVTLPAWKNTFSLYVLQQEQKQSAELLAKVSDATDAALRQSADLLRQNSNEIAKARNRDVVSVDTLNHINAQLIGAVEDVKRIDAESRTRRKAESVKLLAMEAELVNSFVPGKR